MMFAFSQAQYLKVDGKTLKTANGTPLILKGINYPVLEDHGIDLNDAQTFKSRIDEFIKTGSNTIRISWNTNGVHWRDLATSGTPGTLQSYIDSGKLGELIDYCSSKGLYTILEIHDKTCENDWNYFNTKIMDFWKQTAIKNLVNARQDRVIINLANEFAFDSNHWSGSGNTAAIASNYSAAVSALRTAGYKVPIMIDAPNCGTASTTINSIASSIYNADNLKNIIFSVHTYWSGYAETNAAIDAKMLEIKNSPYYFFLGEIANKQDQNACGDLDIANIYKRVLTKACEYGIGWLAWSYYYDCGGGPRNVTNNGLYSGLTPYGDDIVNNSVYGLKSTTCYSTMAVGNQMLDMKGIRIVPNPAKDDFKIESDKKVVSVQAFDFGGKLLKLKTTNNHDFKVQSSTGVVNLKIKLEDGSEVAKKLIIEK